MKKLRGDLLIYLIPTVALVLWIIRLDPQYLFYDVYSTLTTIAKACGIIGLSFLAVNLTLSGRYRFLDTLFGGLDKVYLSHKRTGKLAFYLLTIHFPLMSLRYIQFSLSEVLKSSIDIFDIPVTFGRLAYFGIAIIVLITLFVKKLKYETIKSIHQLIGFFVLLGGIHAYLIPSDIAVNLPLRIYLLGIVTLALVSYLLRTVLAQWSVKRSYYTVKQVNRLNNNVTEVVMKANRGSEITFVPGQFIFTKFEQEGMPFEEHPFSLTAPANSNGELRISAKYSGDFTTENLPRLKPGAIAHIQGAFGGFSCFRIDGKEQVWIAGGIGITPFMSMIRTIALSKEFMNSYNIHLFYSITNSDENVYVEELQEYVEKIENFKLTLRITEHEGRLNAEQVLAKVGEWDKKEFMICGPQPMIESISQQLENAGVSKEKIHFELFRLI